MSTGQTRLFDDLHDAMTFIEGVLTQGETRPASSREESPYDAASEEGVS